MNQQSAQAQPLAKGSSVLSTWLLNPWFLGAAGLILICVCLQRNHSFYHDDTFITLRYARHILAGYGPVWNIAGPRVEGFTSVLHLSLVTLVAGLHVPLPVAARTVNIASHLLLICFVAVYLARRTNRDGACLGALIIAASWILLIWDLGGLDAVLYTFLSAAGVLTGIGYFDQPQTNLSRPLLWGSVYLAFATLARPEGVLLLGGLWLLALIFSREQGGQRVKSLGVAVSAAFIVLLPSVIFRWVFFHALVPNTFYAKIGGIGKGELIRLGVQYVVAYFSSLPFLGLLAIAAATFSIFKRRFRARDSALWAMIVLIILFIVASGGDHMADYRFCLPLVPLFTVALIQHLYQTGLLEDGAFSSVFVPILLVALALQARSHRLNPTTMDDAAYNGVIVGRYIHQNWLPGSIVALNTAGSTPYYADEMEYIDMLGLNDAVIARRRNIPENGPWTHLVGHLKGDGANVLSRHPDYIILGPSQGTRSEFTNDVVFFIGDYEIKSSPSFKEDYEACQVTIQNDLLFTFYQRRDAHRPCPPNS